MNVIKAMSINGSITRFKASSGGFKARLSEYLTCINKQPITAEKYKILQELENIQAKYKGIEDKVNGLFAEHQEAINECASLIQKSSGLSDFLTSTISPSEAMNTLLISNVSEQQRTDFIKFSNALGKICNICEELKKELSEANNTYASFEKWIIDNHYGVDIFSDMDEALVEYQERLHRHITSLKYSPLNHKYEQFKKQTTGSMDKRFAAIKTAAFYHYLVSCKGNEQLEAEYGKLMSILTATSEYEISKYNEHLNQLITRNRKINKERIREAHVYAVLFLILLGMFSLGVLFLFVATIPVLMIMAALIPVTTIAVIAILAVVAASPFILSFELSFLLGSFGRLLAYAINTSSAQQGLLCENIAELDIPEKKAEYFNHGFYKEYCDDAKAILQKNDEAKSDFNKMSDVSSMMGDGTKARASEGGFYSEPSRAREQAGGCVGLSTP